ncbi:hypothetical protein DFJ73DRAFT_964266 [Zopfochytrium polystomum]|nr:hypothetical protein DFJ73DRAFT_964266 [Zopfochytrium polystomum]
MPLVTDSEKSAYWYVKCFNNFPGSTFASDFTLSQITATNATSLTYSNTFNLVIPASNISIDNIGEVTLFVNVTDPLSGPTPFLLGTMKLSNFNLNSTSGSFSTPVSLVINFKQTGGVLDKNDPLFKLFARKFQSFDRSNGAVTNDPLTINIFGSALSTPIVPLQDAFASLNITSTIKIPPIPSTVSFAPSSIGLPKLLSYTSTSLVFGTTVTFKHPDSLTLIDIGKVDFTVKLAADSATVGTFSIDHFSLPAGDKQYSVNITVALGTDNTTSVYQTFLRAFDSTQSVITPPNALWQGVAVPPAISAFFDYTKPLTFDPVPTVQVTMSQLSLSVLTSATSTALKFSGSATLASSANIINLQTVTFRLLATNPSTVVPGVTGPTEISSDIVVPNVDFSTNKSPTYSYSFTVNVGTAAAASPLYKLFLAEFSVGATVPTTLDAQLVAASAPIAAPAVSSFFNFTTKQSFVRSPAPSVKTLTTLDYGKLKGVSASTLSFDSTLTLANAVAANGLAVPGTFTFDFALVAPTLIVHGLEGCPETASVPEKGFVRGSVDRLEDQTRQATEDVGAKVQQRWDIRIAIRLEHVCHVVVQVIDGTMPRWGDEWGWQRGQLELEQQWMGPLWQHVGGILQPKQPRLLGQQVGSGERCQQRHGGLSNGQLQHVQQIDGKQLRRQQLQQSQHGQREEDNISVDGFKVEVDRFEKLVNSSFKVDVDTEVHEGRHRVCAVQVFEGSGYIQCIRLAGGCKDRSARPVAGQVGKKPINPFRGMGNEAGGHQFVEVNGQLSDNVLLECRLR